MPIEKKVEEIIYEAKRSHLNRIFVEGREDMPVYRSILEAAKVKNVCLEPCFGRKNVLAIFEKRAAFVNNKNLFFADQDMWLFVGIPEKYTEIYFTKGYSIENDLFTDGEKWLEGLLSEQEKTYKAQILESLIDWFAFEVEKYEKNPSEELNFADITLLNTNTMPEKKANFTEDFLQKRDFSNANEINTNKIKEKYGLSIRGKYLFQLLEKIFQERKKQQKDSTTFTKNQLWEICLNEGKRTKNTCIQRFINIIQQYYHA